MSNSNTTPPQHKRTGALVLTRRYQETVVVDVYGVKIEFTIVSKAIGPGFRVAIKAPRECGIHRKELVDN